MSNLFREPENKGIDCRVFYTILQITESCKYYDDMEMYIVSLGKGEAELEIPVEAKHLNPLGIVHGGVIFSLADTVMGLAINTLDADCVTMDAQINYIKPGKVGDVIKARGMVVKFGRKIIVTRAEIVNQKNELVAILNGTYYNNGEKISDKMVQE